MLRNPHRLPMLIEHQRIRCTPVSSGVTGSCQRLTFDDGQEVFAKFAEKSPDGFLEAEAFGLRLLSEATEAVPKVWAVTEEVLVTDWIPAGSPSPTAARELGRELAMVHRSGMDAYGAPWKGFVGAIEMDNEQSYQGSWGEWFVAKRLRPFIVRSVDSGGLDTTDAVLLEDALNSICQLEAPAEPIARVHGDLWPGNVMWGADRAYLIDPAAHGGHRETDIASLHLWGGLPHLPEFLEGYEAVWPLAEGWKDRLGINQLFLLLVHTALFGQSYRGQVMRAAIGL